MGLSLSTSPPSSSSLPPPPLPPPIKLSANTIANKVDIVYREMNDVLRDNFIYIPERYVRPMIQTGVAHQLIKIIDDINCIEQPFKSSRSKRRWEEIDEEFQSKKLKKEDASTQTTPPCDPILFDPTEQSFEDLPSGYTFFTKSFYESDD